MLVQEEKVQHVEASGDEPCSYLKAINSSERDLWEEAMRDEILSLKANNTWSLKELPHDRKALSGKWVFKKKIGIDGKVAQYKARWVVKGFEQRYKLDYDQTFASVVKPMSYKIIFSLAAIHNWEIEHMDIKTAFLYGKIDEKVYVEQPTGFIKDN